MGRSRPVRFQTAPSPIPIAISCFGGGLYTRSWSGRAIALGHPIAGTGRGILTTLMHQIHRPSGQEGGRGASPRTGRRGLATLCASGGLGVAAEIETV